MKRVLVIDDDDGVRESFRAALEDAGYAVTTATTAPRASSRPRRNARIWCFST
jgi:CheY-like chemotaxis protein